MRQILLLWVLTTLGGGGGLTGIATQNHHRDEAATAFQAGNYAAAVTHYRALDSLGGATPASTLNLGHAYFKAGQQDAAARTYQQLANTPDPAIRTVAEQQLGLMAYNSKRIEPALDHFKRALRADPTNQAARRNYELVKKLKEKQDQQKDQQQEKEPQNKEKQDEEQQEKEQQNQDQPGQPSKEQQEKEQQEQEGKEQDQDQEQPGKEQQDQEKQAKEQQDQEQSGQKSKEKQDQEQQDAQSDEPSGTDGQNDRPPSQVDREQLRKMNLSEEKARMILDAMRDGEIQYLQQKKHQSDRNYDPSKPDW